MASDVIDRIARMRHDLMRDSGGRAIPVVVCGMKTRYEICADMPWPVHPSNEVADTVAGMPLLALPCFEEKHLSVIDWRWWHITPEFVSWSDSITVRANKTFQSAFGFCIRQATPQEIANLTETDVFRVAAGWDNTNHAR